MIKKKDLILLKKNYKMEKNSDKVNIWEKKW